MASHSIAYLALIVLVGCGGGANAPNESVPRRDHTPPEHLTFTPDAGSDEIVVDLTSKKDAGFDCAAAEHDASVPDAPAMCPTRIGHCLTHMATRCYETSFDDTVACDASGMSSGWHEGSCETTRSTGGCIIGCDVSYSYRLGGYPPDDVSRAGAKIQCDSAGGTFIDTIPSDGGTY